MSEPPTQMEDALETWYGGRDGAEDYYPLALVFSGCPCSRHLQFICGSSVTEGSGVQVLFPGTW